MERELARSSASCRRPRSAGPVRGGASCSRDSESSSATPSPDRSSYADDTLRPRAQACARGLRTSRDSGGVAGVVLHFTAANRRVLLELTARSPERIRDRYVEVITRFLATGVVRHR